MTSGTKIGKFKESNEQLSAQRTQYIFINKIQTNFHSEMKNKYVLDQLSAAHALTVMTLKEADRVFYRQRRTIEDQIGLTHGVIGEV